MASVTHAVSTKIFSQLQKSPVNMGMARTRDPKIPQPETITLRDGRVFATQDLVKRTRDRATYNLKSYNRTRKPIAPRQIKYTIEDRIWQSQATAEAIAERYQLTEQQAQAMKYQARYIVDVLDQQGEIIIHNTVDK